MLRIKRKTRFLSLLLCALLLLTAFPQFAAAESESAFQQIQTSVHLTGGISATSGTSMGSVSYAAQFMDAEGNFCVAVNEGGSIIMVRTHLGNVISTMQFPMAYPIFGTMLCDADGNYYIVTGQNRDTSSSDRKSDQVFISKYAPDGRLLATTGFNGLEGTPAFGVDFCTKQPFHGGNCEAAIQNGVLLVNYAREMNSGHQSNALAAVRISDMSKVTDYAFYNSHSFDQRVTPLEDGGFLLASRGDCYPRAFSIALAEPYRGTQKLELFHFWTQQGTLDNGNMYALNRTRSHLGNVLETENGIALIGSSVRSLNAEAQNEAEDVFVQVLRKGTKGTCEADYLTSGVRSGYSGGNGNEFVTDYGVSWLTSLNGLALSMGGVQAVKLDGDRIFVLYELMNESYQYQTWYVILNGDGSIAQSARCLGDVALNANEMPVYAEGAVQWASTNWDPEVGAYVLVVNAVFPDVDSAACRQWRWERLDDVKDPTSYYYASVKWAVENGLALGRSDDFFGPETNCPRSEIVTFLWKAAGSPEVGGKNPFTDVSSKDDYYDAVLWAYVNGITTGTTTTTFSPDDTVTRAQAMTFLYRSENGSAGSAKNVFQDVPEDAYYRDAVLWALERHITNGTSATAFSPELPCNRAHILTFLYRDLVEPY